MTVKINLKKNHIIIISNNIKKSNITKDNNYIIKIIYII